MRAHGWRIASAGDRRRRRADHALSLPPRTRERHPAHAGAAGPKRVRKLHWSAAVHASSPCWPMQRRTESQGKAPGTDRRSLNIIDLVIRDSQIAKSRNREIYETTNHLQSRESGRWQKA